MASDVIPPGRERSNETGSATAEFVMVVVLLTLLTLSVLQLGLALYVRNTVLDTAAEGARFAALGGNSLADGVERTRELLALSLGDRYAADVTAGYGQFDGYASAEIRVRAPLPVIGLLGPGSGLEVVGHAPVESAGE